MHCEFGGTFLLDIRACNSLYIYILTAITVTFKTCISLTTFAKYISDMVSLSFIENPAASH